MKNAFFRFSSIVIAFVCSLTITFAQPGKTSEELKAEREQLKSELKSKDVVSREEKLAKISQKLPEPTNVQSVDGLVNISAGFLASVKSTNDFLQTYKREIVETSGGEFDITNHKAKLSDYEKLAISLAESLVAIVSGMEQLKNVQSEIKSMSPLAARPALKSLDFSKDALSLSKDEISLQAKIIKNLVSTIKSSNNL